MELDELQKLHTEMMEKFEPFVGAFAAWESKANTFKAFKAPDIRFLD